MCHPLRASLALRAPAPVRAAGYPFEGTFFQSARNLSIPMSVRG